MKETKGCLHGNRELLRFRNDRKDWLGIHEDLLMWTPYTDKIICRDCGEMLSERKVYPIRESLM